MQLDFIFAVVIVTLAVFGSVVWIRPSPREKKIAQWRQQALTAGLKVRLEGFKADPKESGIREDVEGVSYQLLNLHPSKKDTVRWAVLSDEGWLKDHLPDGWSWYQKQASDDLVEKIVAQIKKAPLDIIGIERTPHMSRIVWNETGKNFDPDSLKQFLQEVQSIA